MRGFFRTIPSDLLDAARWDGASEFGYLAHPDALGTARAGHPGDHRRPRHVERVVNRAGADQSERTNGRCRSGCYSFGASSRRHTELTAAILIVILPILVLYILFQRYLISGLTAGALKE